MIGGALINFPPCPESRILFPLNPVQNFTFKSKSADSKRLQVHSSRRVRFEQGEQVLPGVGEGASPGEEEKHFCDTKCFGTKLSRGRGRGKVRQALPSRTLGPCLFPGRAVAIFALSMLPSWRMPILRNKRRFWRNFRQRCAIVLVRLDCETFYFMRNEETAGRINDERLPAVQLSRRLDSLPH